MNGFSLDAAALLQSWAATVSASYGVNPYLFIALTTICAPAFYFSIYRLTKALATRQRRHVSTWSTVFLGAAALPYGYVLVYGRNLPWWIYLVLGVLLAQGFASLVRKLTNRSGLRPPVGRAGLFTRFAWGARRRRVATSFPARGAARASLSRGRRTAASARTAQ